MKFWVTNRQEKRIPKFDKQCYNCTNRFICWTNREDRPKINGLPHCKKCGKELEIIDTYTINLDIVRKEYPITMVCAKCPEYKIFNGHDKHRYYETQSGKWVK